MTVADARSGLEAVKLHLQSETVAGQTYWHSTSKAFNSAVVPNAHILSVFDEYISGYKDRSAIVSEKDAAKFVALGNALTYLVVVDGQIVGACKRTLKRGAVVITTDIFRRLTKAEGQAVREAAHRYGTFVGLPVVLQDQ